MKNYLAILTVLNKENVPIGNKLIRTQTSNLEKAEANILHYLKCYNTYNIEKRKLYL
jgi:hypothetical protein